MERQHQLPGGLDCQSIVPFGTLDALRVEAKRLKAEMGTGGGYILAPAKSLQPEMSTGNAVAAVEASSESSAADSVPINRYGYLGDAK